MILDLDLLVLLYHGLAETSFKVQRSTRTLWERGSEGQRDKGKEGKRASRFVAPIIHG